MWGLGLITFGAVLLTSLLKQPHAGQIGNGLAHAFRWLVGVGSYAVPFFFVGFGINLVRGRERSTRVNLAGSATVLFLVIITWWHLINTNPGDQWWSLVREHNGGYVGASLCKLLRAAVDDGSSHIILAAITIATIVWGTDMRLLHIFDRGVSRGKKIAKPVVKSAQVVKESTATLRDKARDANDARREAQEARRRDRIIAVQERSVKAAAAAAEAEAAEAAAAEETPTVKNVAPPRAEPPAESVPAVKPSKFKPATAAPFGMINHTQEPPEEEIEEPFVRPAAASAPVPEPVQPVAKPLPPAKPAPARPLLTLEGVPVIDNSAPAAPAGPLVIPKGLGEDGTASKFELPPLELLNESPPKPVQHEKATQEKQAILMQTLNDFRIGANVSQVAIGPTVTRYEVQLEPGILVKKIVSLADNLAMSLAAIDVRVEAPIPGKSAIGIEVPNDVVQMVSLRECLSTNEFMQHPSKLAFALGKDVSGVYKYADLARMPHLLIGGSTNSGKSVCLNVLISSMLYRATPREVKFIMIDPKRVELSLYDGIPHLLAPVIKDVKHAAGILRSVLKEMEERYDRFARIGTRNLEGYNSRVPPEERLHFIVVVIDELADLMMQQGPEVETSICRLAQLARATGIHLVIATQRPSVDVITGTIKANVGSRIAFAVATQVDSRTIIDMPGADRLIGRGDMLYMPIDAAKPVRVQGCYIGERETDTLVAYLKEQEPVVYTMIPSETSASGSSYEDDDTSSDELWEPAVKWLVSQGQCSTSSLQRKFKIGYTRAARLVEGMEAMQIVGPQDGVKPREVLLRPENVAAFFAGSGQGTFDDHSPF